MAKGTWLFRLTSGAMLATMVDVVVEVPLMLSVSSLCSGTRGWFVLTPEPGVGGRAEPAR